MNISHSGLTPEARVAVVVLSVLMILAARPTLPLTVGLLVLCTQGNGVKIHLYQDVHNVSVTHNNINQEINAVSKTDRAK